MFIVDFVVKVGHLIGELFTMILVWTISDIPCSQVEHMCEFFQIVLKWKIVIELWMYFSSLIELFMDGDPSNPVLNHDTINNKKSSG